MAPPPADYPLAGAVIGPNTPGEFANTEAIQVVAQICVAFLMFTVGVQFSLEELQRVRRVALPETSMAQMAVRKAKQLAPEVQVVARVHRREDAQRAKAAGADAVTCAEQEVAASIIRQSLEHLGMDPPDAGKSLQ